MSSRRSLGLALAAAAAAMLLPASARAQVRFERTGYRLTSIGEKIAVSARVVDGRRRPVASANIRWRVADPSIATVSKEGVVVSRRVGYTRLWAVAGGDSASALILVDQWAATFDFFPSLLRLDAVGAKVPLRIQVRDAAGQLIPEANRKSTTCRSLNPRVAALAASGEVEARSNGVTWVRCTDRGVADSVRVEVRQRVERAVIADKGSVGVRQVGDTFRLQLRATDSRGDVISDAQATWASLNPGIVNVDPLTGVARSVGPGDVRIIAQAGDATDTLTVRVQSANGMLPVTPVDTVVGLAAAPATPTLQFNSLFPFEGDTTSVTFTARDASGAVVANPEVRLSSTDTSIVTILSRQRILPKKAGTAYVIGLFGSVRDSTQVTVRTRSSRVATADDNEQNTFVRPSIDSVAARASYAVALRAVRDSIFRGSPVGRQASGRLISFTAIAGPSSHSFSDSSSLERRSGLLYGGLAEIAPVRLLKLSAAFRTGTLSSNKLAGGADLTITEVEADLTFQPTHWFGLQGGYVRRATREGDAGTAKLALRQWNFPRVAGILRFTFVGGAVSTLTSVAVLPAATYTGYFDEQGKPVNPNPFSLAGETGLELHTGWLRAGISYYVEKFTFPKVGTSEREDQFSSLRLRLGIETPR